MYLTFTSTYIGVFQEPWFAVVNKWSPHILSDRQGHWRHLVQRTDGLGFLDIKGHDLRRTQVTFTWFLVGWFDDFVVKNWIPFGLAIWLVLVGIGRKAYEGVFLSMVVFRCVLRKSHNWPNSQKMHIYIYMDTYICSMSVSIQTRPDSIVLRYTWYMQRIKRTWAFSKVVRVYSNHIEIYQSIPRGCVLKKIIQIPPRESTGRYPRLWSTTLIQILSIAIRIIVPRFLRWLRRLN